MTAPRTKASGEVVQRMTGQAAIAAFANLVTRVPEATDDDGTGIIGRIMEAETVADLMADDGLPSSQDLQGQVLRVFSIARRPSDNPSMTGFYLIVEAEEVTKKTPARHSAGGEQAVAMLAKLHLLQAFPATIRYDEVTTKGGKTAINCKVIEASSPNNGKS
jgi:hypothetical protein